MSNFPSITPSYGTSKSSSPKTLAVQYGDGYSTRLVFGLNQDLKEYSLRWDNLSETNANSIETFLEAIRIKGLLNLFPLNTLKKISKNTLLGSPATNKIGLICEFILLIQFILPVLRSVE